MFKKILIANRGEIACRIIRTARRLGIGTVAVYSDADERALHTRLADEAYRIGPARAEDSYLNGAAILQAAESSQAEAIHPGYGFLSENADFAAACNAAGLVFVGPPAEAIRAMGDKSRAKQLMEEAGVPLLPGYHGADQQAETLRRQAQRIGYPLLIKAAAGGGGKGIRLVERAADFAEALSAVRSEAQAAFGDRQVLLEKYLEAPRHIEIQLFADRQGQVLHLFERECSLQRRQQKVIEEAPAPGMTPQRRKTMAAAAVAAARAINYVGAGTVEFLLDANGHFYFMEMNTRLQVEHPVTELITSRDLVEWQLLVAAGSPLPCRQEQLAVEGHAIEARIYAEDPDHDFRPATGRLELLQLPGDDEQVRFDSGVAQGDRIQVHYDPLLAKLIVWGPDRETALRRLQRALGATRIVGLPTNLEFLSRLAALPAFCAGHCDTDLIRRQSRQLLPGPQPLSDRVLALACLTLLLRRNRAALLRARRSAEPASPWHRTDGWRLHSDRRQLLRFQQGDRQLTVTAHERDSDYLLELPGRTLPARGELSPAGELIATLDGSIVKATVAVDRTTLWLYYRGEKHQLQLVAAWTPSAEQPDAGHLAAPMPGRIVALPARPGTPVRRGEPLVVLEAMKMQYSIRAPHDGRVARMHYRIDELVEEGALLLDFETLEGEEP